VALSHYPSDNEPWWRPDGTRVGENLFTTKASGGPSDEFQTYSVVARLHGVPDDASDPVWRLEPRNSWAQGWAIANHGKPDGQLAMISTKQPRAAKTMNVSIGVAAGPWETIAEARANKIPPLPKPTKYGDVLFQQPSEVDKGIRCTVTHTFRGMDMRLIAMKDDGTERLGTEPEQVKTDKLGSTCVTFPGIS